MKIVAALISTTLIGCVSTHPHDAALEWSSMGTGCHTRGLSDVLLRPDDIQTSIGLTDIRIGRLPDTGGGPGLLVHFRRNLGGLFGQPMAEPQLLLAVGDWKTSCSLLIEQTSCPVASEIYETLSTMSIPIGYAFNKPRPLQVIHGDMYFLSVTDGHGNQTNWGYYGLDHPLRDAISASLDQLASCAEPAAIEFRKAEL